MTNRQQLRSPVKEESLRTDSMRIVVSELSRELVASPSKEVDDVASAMFLSSMILNAR